MGTANLIRAHLAEAGITNYRVKDHYDLAPADRARDIADILIRKARSIANRVPKRKRCYSGDRIWKTKLLEAQNHRCGYCGCRMTTSNPFRVDYATFEHYVNLRDGGSDGIGNNVMACSLCNNLRDQLDLSAEDYCDWVGKNQKRFESHRKAQFARWIRKGRFLPLPDGFVPLYESE